MIDLLEELQEQQAQEIDGDVEEAVALLNEACADGRIKHSTCEFLTNALVRHQWQVQKRRAAPGVRQLLAEILPDE